MSLPTVGLWRRNFSERGLEGLETAPRTGRPREIDDAQVAAGVGDDVGGPAGRQYALERAAAGGGGGDFGLDGVSDLA